MEITLTLHANQTSPAGDVVYPLRLLVSPAGGQLDAPAWLCREAQAAADRLSVGSEPGAVLIEAIAPRMAALGYRPLPRAGVPIVCWTPGEPISPPACPGLCRLSDAPACGWALSHPRADLPDDAWVVVADGRAVAAAWLTPDGIAVETAPAFRRRGFARAAAAALAAARLAEGREVCYRCAETNTASMALAVSLGFVPAAREYCPGFRRI